MKRFVDLRNQDIDSRFAWWDTILEAFECHSGNYAWNTISEFKADYQGDELDRYVLICPWWATALPNLGGLVMQTDKELLNEIAHQLDRWSVESLNGGWSTHQVAPMRDLSLKIFAHLGRPISPQSYTYDSQEGRS